MYIKNYYSLWELELLNELTAFRGFFAQNNSRWFSVLPVDLSKLRRRFLISINYNILIKLTQNSYEQKSLNLTKSFRKFDKYVHSNIEILVLSVSLYFPRRFFRHEWIFYKRTRSSCWLETTELQASNSAEAGLSGSKIKIHSVISLKHKTNQR